MQSGSIPIPVEKALKLLYQGIQKTLLNEPKLFPKSLPEDFVCMTGKLRGEEVTMDILAWTSPNYESIVLACLYDSDERIKTVTLIGLPGTGSALPIIGLDVVAIGTKWSLLAIDLAATDLQYWEQYCRLALMHLHQKVLCHLKLRDLPEFAKHSFSPLAMIGAVKEGFEKEIAHYLLDFVNTDIIALFSQAKTITAVDKTVAVKNNLAWRHAERNNRKEQKVLSYIFGNNRAKCLIEEHLFPLPKNNIDSLHWHLNS